MVVLGSPTGTGQSANASDGFLEFAYYYPPSSMLASNITSVSASDQYLMVNITYTPGFTSVIGWILGTPVTIAMTPQAFVGWYQNNSSSIAASALSVPLTNTYNTLNTNYGAFSSVKSASNPTGNCAYEQAQAAFINSSGFQLIPYSTWYTDNPTHQNYILNDIAAAFDLNITYAELGSTDNLYALTNPGQVPIQYSVFQAFHHTSG